jgi:hypothetical protein
MVMAACAACVTNKAALAHTSADKERFWGINNSVGRSIDMTASIFETLLGTRSRIRTRTRTRTRCKGLNDAESKSSW